MTIHTAERCVRYLLATFTCCACSLTTPSLDHYTHDFGSEDAGAHSATQAQQARPFEAEPLLWLAADRGVSVDPDGRVLRWEDQSTHQRHAEPGEVSSPPTRERSDRDTLPYLLFDGTNELSLPAFDSFNELSFFAVAEAGAGEEDRACPSILHMCNWKDAFMQSSDVEVGRHMRELYYENNNEYVPHGTAYTNTFSIERPHVLALIHSSDDTASTYVDGSEVHRGLVHAPDPVSRVANYIGHNHYYSNGKLFCSAFKGRLAELLLFGMAMSDEERARIEHYLSEKWSVPAP